jgi:hypothetical protein
MTDILSNEAILYAILTKNIVNSELNLSIKYWKRNGEIFIRFSSLCDYFAMYHTIFEDELYNCENIITLGNYLSDLCIDKFRDRLSKNEY